MVDRSGSIVDFEPYDENWIQIKNFLYGLVDSVQVGRGATQIGLLTFSDKVELALKLDTCNNGECVKGAIANMAHPVSS